MGAPVTPRLAVDCIIEIGGGIVLIERKNKPRGWALPGGFVEVGESLADACRREMREETGLGVELTEQFFAYSDPKRDPRGHTVTVVYIGRAEGAPKGGDDAKTARIFKLDQLPNNLVFDHPTVLTDYLRYSNSKIRPDPLR